MGQVRDLHGLEVRKRTEMEERLNLALSREAWDLVAGREAGREWSKNQGMCWPLPPGEGHLRYSEQEALVM